MNYIKYNRSFIMLEEQNNEFAAKAAPVKGHIKVETGNNKGALRCAVQNLKYYEKGEYIYKLIFFGTKNEKTIHTIIGTLFMNRQGSGESYFRFQPNNIDGKGNEFHDYTSAIVAAVSTVNDKESLHPVLRGSIMGNAEALKVDDNREISAASFQAEDKSIEGEATQSDTKQSDTEKQSEKQAESKQAEEDRNFIEKESINYNHFYNKCVLNSCIHTSRMAEFYEDIEPFDTDKTGAVWKKIVNVASLPLVSPGAHYFATQYRHYIFGAKEGEDHQVSRFYFGIPGRFLNEEQPDGGESGFTFWQPIKGAPNMTGEGSLMANANIARQNAYGYWIVSVDAKTGDLKSIQPAG